MTEVHKDFTCEPIGCKCVECLPGIGSVTGQKLKEQGIVYAGQVLGQFLLFDGEKDPFLDWLNWRIRGPNTRPWFAKECYEALVAWCNRYITHNLPVTELKGVPEGSWQAKWASKKGVFVHNSLESSFNLG